MLLNFPVFRHEIINEFIDAIETEYVQTVADDVRVAEYLKADGASAAFQFLFVD